MSKKSKKEEAAPKQVNTDIDMGTAYYNYEEPVVYETKKPGFFKKLFRGKKKVTSSSELAQEDDFYGNFDSDNASYQDVNYQQPMNIQRTEQVQQMPQQPVNQPQQQVTPPKKENEKYVPPGEDTGELNYNRPMVYNQQTQTMEEEDKLPISKTTGYIVGAVVLVAAIGFGLIKLLSSATQKYYVNVNTTSISLRPYESQQITFLTNDTKKTKFKSSNESVVTVNEFGYITAKGYRKNSDGYMKATITVGGSTINKTIDVYVVPTSDSIPMEDFSVPSDISLKLNEKMLIEISDITPPNNTRQQFDYIAADSSIIDVNGVGLITAKKRGTTTIEVRNHINKDISKIINVTVK